MTENTSETKKCIACAEEIKKEAKKCPHCRQIQSKAANLFNNPTLGVSFFIIMGLLIVYLLYSLINSLNYYREGFDEYRPLLKISDQAVNFEDRKTNLYVSCMGNIKNTSSLSWTDLYFETKFYDSSGVFIDTLSDRENSLFIGKGKEISFRVRGIADKDPSRYERCETSITNATSDWR